MRFQEIDAARGLAILAMMAYHFLFDLNYFGILPVSIQSPPLLLFQRSIGTLFLLLVGVSLSISYAKNAHLGNGQLFLKQFKRFALLAAVAILITAATYAYPRDGFIVFGIIHMIAASVLLSFFFRRLGSANFIAGAALVVLSLALAGTTGSPWLLPLGITFPGFYTLDYYPLLPWFGLVLIGMALGDKLYKNAKRTFRLSISNLSFLEFLGRHSLVIYLAHQPLIVGLLLLLRFLALI